MNHIYMAFLEYLLALSALYFLSNILKLSRHSRLPLSPGPRKLPLLGNILDMPQEKEWLVFPNGKRNSLQNNWARTLEEIVEQPFSFVKKETSVGNAKPSYTTRLLEQDLETEFDIKWSAASLYAVKGGADTTVATIFAFFKAMTLCPDIQAKAQSEIDSVVGNDRLPLLSDRNELQYKVNALTLEVLQWHTIAPMGIPHRVTEDNDFNGFHLPKGALVLANIWHMTHDPKLYHESMKFMPERFLSIDGSRPEMDTRELSFEFGRRICPGRLLADTLAFIACAMTLATFNIGKYFENGIEILPDIGQTPGTVGFGIFD
ncbi:cytochrome P450 [Gymnopus androsaceus JB14]|uniref:Cytochrome P450 n=1 Tax=Gymnopus androsaceus JB14 TaxID=1447944 RepID=A0A6A4I6V9_9AGAR|nr:cytochrome P450 [Gymnopus androsaceus JB14]